jgi:serine/threonine protein kinase
VTAQVHALDDSPLAAGEKVADRFVAGAIIGTGATSVVYRGEAIADGRSVALKVVHRELCGDKQIFGRYEREAKILKRLTGPNIVKLLDFVEHGELLVIALELVEGATLERVLERPLDLNLAIEVASQIAEGLSMAHAAGVVHRDLKPANVVVEPVGWPHDTRDPPRVRILDFGLAKVIHGPHMTTGLTEHDMIFGTPEYMSPEQARGDEVDARSDLYAAGVILYEMATGKVPFSGRTALATMHAHLTEELVGPRIVAPNREIPAALDAVIGRALSKDPKDRYASAAAFKEALRAVNAPRAASVRPSSSDRVGTTDMELGETDLAIRLSQVPVERKQEIEARVTRSTPPEPASATPGRFSSGATQISALVPEPRLGRGWIVLGVLVGALAIAAGVYLASR